MRTRVERCARRAESIPPAGCHRVLLGTSNLEAERDELFGGVPVCQGSGEVGTTRSAIEGDAIKGGNAGAKTDGVIDHHFQNIAAGRCQGDAPRRIVGRPDHIHISPVVWGHIILVHAPDRKFGNPVGQNRVIKFNVLLIGDSRYDTALEGNGNGRHGRRDAAFGGEGVEGTEAVGLVVDRPGAAGADDGVAGDRSGHLCRDRSVVRFVIHKRGRTRDVRYGRRTHRGGPRERDGHHQEDDSDRAVDEFAAHCVPLSFERWLRLAVFFKTDLTLKNIFKAQFVRYI